MKRRTWPLTSNAHATTRLAAAFGAGLVGGASVGCAPAAAAHVAVPAVVRTAGPSNVPRQASDLCAVPTTRDQELADAHAAVREALVSNKKDAIRASYQGAVILRSAESAQGGSTPGEPQNVDDGRNSEAEDAKLESALAAVDADESYGKGPASDDKTRIEIGEGAIAYFFAGSISANAGGYNRGWGILVAKDGCAWKRVGGDFTSDPMKVLRAPSGAPVLVQTHDGDGSLYECRGGETRLFLVQSANEVHDLRIPASLEKSSCRGAPRAELKIEEGTLTGVRILSSSADTPEGEEKWNEAGYVVFENGKYILHQASR